MTVKGTICSLTKAVFLSHLLLFGRGSGAGGLRLGVGCFLEGWDGWWGGGGGAAYGGVSEVVVVGWCVF